MPTAIALESHLNALFDHLETLRPDSPPSSFEKFASFFSENCTAHLLSMREHNEHALGRQAVIDKMHEILKDQYLEKSRLVSKAVDQHGLRVFYEMENRHIVHGTVIDPLHETIVVVFDESGLISNFRVYSCRSIMLAVIQKATGFGPYQDWILDLVDRELERCCPGVKEGSAPA